MTTEKFRLPEPVERRALEPFYSVYLAVLIPEATNGGWFERTENPPDHEIARISRRVESELAKHLGVRLHPAIYVHALEICAHFLLESVRTQDEAVSYDLVNAVDWGYSLAKHLELHHGLSDLYVCL